MRKAALSPDGMKAAEGDPYPGLLFLVRMIFPSFSFSVPPSRPYPFHLDFSVISLSISPGLLFFSSRSDAPLL